MNVVSTVGRGVAWNSASAIVGKALMFTNVLIILTFVSVYEYGFSELVLSVISMIGIVLLPGLTSTLIADMSVERGRENYTHLNELFFHQLLLNIVLGVCSWAFLFFLSNPVAALAGNPYAAQFLQIASFLFLISPFRTSGQTLAAVMLRFFDQSFYGVIEEVCKLIILLICVVWLSMGIHGLMYAIVFSQLAGVIIFAPRTYSAYRLFAAYPSNDWFRFWDIVRGHRTWSVGTSYIGTFTQNARIWIIKFFLGTEAVALFSFAYGLFSHIVSLFPLTTVLAPIIPRYIERRDQMARILRAALKIQLVVAIAFVIGSYIFGYLFVSLFFPKYIAAVPLLYVILLGTISNSAIALFTPVFAAFKDQRSFLFSNVFKTFLMLVLLPLMIMAFGIVGIGVEIVLTTFINGIERYFRLRRILPEFTLQFRELFRSDEYESEAMRTVLNTLQSSIARIYPRN